MTMAPRHPRKTCVGSYSPGTLRDSAVRTPVSCPMRPPDRSAVREGAERERCARLHAGRRAHRGVQQRGGRRVGQKASHAPHAQRLLRAHLRLRARAAGYIIKCRVLSRCPAQGTTLVHVCSQDLQPLTAAHGEHDEHDESGRALTCRARASDAMHVCMHAGARLQGHEGSDASLQQPAQLPLALLARPAGQPKGLQTQCAHTNLHSSWPAYVTAMRAQQGCRIDDGRARSCKALKCANRLVRIL